MKSSFVLAYSTARDAQEARAIAAAVVTERLAACANIIDGMNSLYFWEGKLCDEHEAVLIVKTRKSLFPRLMSRIRELHSYDVPCIVALPIVDGNPPFLSWISANTQTPKPPKRTKKEKNGRTRT